MNRLLGSILLVPVVALSTLASLAPAQAATARCAVANPANTTDPAPEPSLALQDQERTASNLLQSIVAGHNSEYAGASVDWSGPAIDIWTLPNATQLDSQLRSASPWFRLHDATRSSVQMRAIDDTILPGDVAFLAAGTTLTETYEDPSSGCIGIGISPYTSLAAESLRQHYGADAVDIFASDPQEAGSASRLADTAPWNGGDYTDSTNGNCTSGLPMVSGSTYYLLARAFHGK